MTAILVLWDIDHTLIENHGVNKETYALAFKLLTGREAEHRAKTDGRTEPEIMRDMLALHGIAPTHDHVARMPEALESATLANAGALRERGHELPGARDVFAACNAPATRYRRQRMTWFHDDMGTCSQYKPERGTQPGSNVGRGGHTFPAPQGNGLWGSASADRAARIDLDAIPESAAAARRHARDTLARWGMTELADDAQAIATELARKLDPSWARL